LRRLEAVGARTSEAVWDEVWVLTKDPGQLNLQALFDQLWSGNTDDWTAGSNRTAGTATAMRMAGSLPRLDVSLASLAANLSRRADPE